MNRLTEIANKYNTDKGTNKLCDNGFCGHGFTEFYYDFFSKYRNPVILEIGVFKGNSIRMFNEFFGGKCEIYCLDVNPDYDVSHLGENIHFSVLDQGDIKEFVKNLNGIKFDIILDDASHIQYNQMLSYSVFRKLLKPNGIYVMEDIHTSFLESWGAKKEPTTTLDFFVGFIPYHMFDEKLNFEMLNEIQTVQLFSNYNGSEPVNPQTLRRNRSMTAIIKLKT